MSTGDTQVTQAAAELAAALDMYERHVHKLVDTWLDMDLYLVVSGEIDAIKLRCAPLPELSVPWIALLISHAELVHCLWRRSQSSPRSETDETQQRLAEHLHSIQLLAARCRTLAQSAGARAATRPA